MGLFTLLDSTIGIIIYFMFLYAIFHYECPLTCDKPSLFDFKLENPVSFHKPSIIDPQPEQLTNADIFRKYLYKKFLHFINESINNKTPTVVTFIGNNKKIIQNYLKKMETDFNTTVVIIDSNQYQHKETIINDIYKSLKNNQYQIFYPSELNFDYIDALKHFFIPKKLKNTPAIFVLPFHNLPEIKECIYNPNLDIDTQARACKLETASHYYKLDGSRNNKNYMSNHYDHICFVFNSLTLPVY